MALITRSARAAFAPSGTSQPTAVAVHTKDDSGFALLVVAIFAVVYASWRGVLHLATDKAFPGVSPTAPVEGLTIFATFFVAAQGLERLLEPIAMLFGESKKEAVSDKTSAAQALVDVSAASPTDVSKATAASAAVGEAAEAKANLASSRSWRKVVFWGIATVAGMAASATLKLYLLTRVGVAHPSRQLEVIATGLIIGGGTQSLHGLVELITAKKEAAQATG